MVALLKRSEHRFAQTLRTQVCSNAPNTGGINSLPTVLQHTPNLEYLFVGAVRGIGEAGIQRFELALPFLSVLRSVLNKLIATHSS